MLNIGLIGDIKLLEPYTKKIHDHSDIHISGKSSVGTNTNTGSFRFSIPEFNRVELIERSDALMINRFSLLPFQLLCNIVKKSKHIFATEYPAISIEECRELAKLATEAQTVVQVNNPLYFLPAIQWLNTNLKKPAYIDISYFRTDFEETDPLLTLLFMLKDITGTEPRKINAISFRKTANEFEFNNARLEFGDASTVNINFGKSHTEEFKIRAWAAGQVVTFNMKTKNYSFNSAPPDLAPFKGLNEFDKFVESSANKSQNLSSINDYLSVLQTLERIRAKLTQVSVS
jgi:hypothetical protein